MYPIKSALRVGPGPVTVDPTYTECQCQGLYSTAVTVLCGPRGDKHWHYYPHQLCHSQCDDITIRGLFSRRPYLQAMHSGDDTWACREAVADLLAGDVIYNTMDGKRLEAGHVKGPRLKLCASCRRAWAKAWCLCIHMQASLSVMRHIIPRDFCTVPACSPHHQPRCIADPHLLS